MRLSKPTQKSAIAGVSTCDQNIRSTQTAELLEANGTKLPDEISEAAIRPLN
jgi:hypothetical protein